MNAGSFFHGWHPGKAYSIRLHNIVLQAVTVPATNSPGEERIEYKHVRMARGLWDSAFRSLNNRPVAFPLHGNVFGEEPYAGAELDILPNQKMQDAYDAVIFLAPLEKLRQSGTSNVIYTPAFMQELKRRFGIIYTEAQLTPVFKRTGAKNLDELFVFLEKDRAVVRPAAPLVQAQEIGPIDEWKSKPKN